MNAPWGIFAPLRKLDSAVYDSLFAMRAVEPKMDGEVVIVAVDDRSIEVMDKIKGFGWPWPREYWGHMVGYFEKCGAKTVAFDVLFDRSSVYNSVSDDDAQFGAKVDEAKIPIVLATIARGDGSLWGVAPPIKNKVLGAANIAGDEVIRSYDPAPFGQPSLAKMALIKSGATPPAWADAPFRLHYYGPHDRGDGTPATFKYIRAASVLAAAVDPKMANEVGVSPEMFRGKIVLVGTITAGTYDLKSSPMSAKYPGVEVHATAIQNMLDGRHVLAVGEGWRIGLMLLACAAGSILTMLPSRVPVKILGGLAGPALILGVCWLLFVPGGQVKWLAPAGPLAAAVVGAFVAMGYSYFTELRQRQFILKAFAQSVSKEVADEIAKDPRKLGLGGQRREMTVMFTDLATFTTLSEAVDVESLASMLQFYLEEMSGVVLGENGTLDKYIGDAIMAFWNAPANQIDHAVRACRAALEMRRREALIQPRILELAGTEVYSRFGINSGPMIVGNIGSSYKFAYTVLGDSVNLASRLEGANKMYGTRIILSETTAAIVKDLFAMRQLDLLRVKGKLKPMAVYELMGEGAPDSAMTDLIARYESALAAYRARRFEEAMEMLEALKRDFPGDGPTATLMARVTYFRAHPPAEDWDGVYVAMDK